jgi:hypothetical protein
MATIDVYSPFNMSNPTIYYGTVVEATATTIVISNDVDETIYSGNFGYNPAILIDGETEVTGTLTGITEINDGVYAYVATGLSINATVAEYYIQSDQPIPLLETALAGNDTFVAETAGTYVLNGYGGINLVVLPDLVNEDHISGNSITGPDVSATLTSIQRIQFIDGTLYYDSGSPAAQIERMYEAALGRAPDPVGLSDWVSALNSGTTLTQVAAGFISSAEFQTRFPGASENATAFVTQLYANVLHRAPDPAGLSGWVSALNSGTQTQAQVLVGFSESPENQNDTAGSLVNGVWVANEQAASVARLYYSTFDRAPDAAGLIGWTNALESGALSLTQEASAFMASAEYFERYGTPSNGAFVTLLYNNVLGRQPDNAGYAGWVSVLNSGIESRAQVMIGFSESPEHVADLASKIEAVGIVLYHA